MKRIKVEELPKILTEEVINTLAEMANEVPQTKDWHQIFDLLCHDDLRRVMDRKLAIQQEQEKARKASMTEEEKADEAAKWERIKNDPDPNKFYGNMGQPETPQEYKNRYGVWPPGYDENGNKLP